MQELIKALRGELVNCNCAAHSSSECCCDCVWPEHVVDKAADMLEAQANEIASLYEMNLAQAMTIKKQGELCDQLGSVLDGHCAPFLGHEEEHRLALEAWRESK